MRTNVFIDKKVHEFMRDNVRSIRKNEQGNWEIIELFDNRDHGGGMNDEELFIISGKKKRIDIGMLITFEENL